MNREKIDFTIKTTDLSVDKYIKDRSNPSIVMNHLEKFSSSVRDCGYIIDIGCGHGRDCKYFEGKGFSVVGIDLSKEMLNVAKKVCDTSVLLDMDILNIKNVPWRFDGVWSCAVLHHIPTDYIDGLLVSIYSILEPCGQLFLSYKVDSSGYLYREDLGIEKYYEIHDPNVIVNKLKSIGFTNIETSFERKEYLWFNIYAMKR